MIYLHLAALFAIGVLWAGHRRMKETGNGTPERYLPAILFGAAFLMRISLSVFSRGFDADMTCFAAWAERMWSVGARGFYSPDAFTDYPPGFLYYLYFVGGLCDKLGIQALSQTQLFLIKLPAILSDMVCGILFYREAKPRMGQGGACFLAAVYLYQPAVLLNSAVWGQVDSILTLALVVLCLALVKGKLPAAYLAFGLGVLLKPQMLVFAPVLLAGILDQVFLDDFSWKKLGCQLLCGLEAIAGIVVLCLPFGIGKVIGQYLSTLGEYPYAAVNACNFWGLLGKNWVSQSEKFLFLSYQGWGLFAILAIVCFTFCISLRRGRERSKYPLLAAFVIVTMFLFSVRMHERYLYPALSMLLLAYLYRPEKGLYLCYGGFCVLNFYNMAAVLFFYDPAHYDRTAPFILIVSAGMLLCGGYLYYRIGRECRHWERVCAFSFGGPSRVTRLDILLMTALTVVYAAFALTDLGDRQAPSTAFDMQSGEEIALEFAEAPASFSYYMAPGHNRHFQLECKNSAAEPWQPATEIVLKDVFKWQNVPLDSSGRQLRFVLEKGQASLLELCFFDSRGNRILPLSTERYEALFDEQALCPERSSFRNGMYFDEIYHGRTAYEYLHGLYSYENTHPPLGKILIALGIAVFGMNPFGWRIVGTLFGILMVPAICLFAKHLTDSTAAAALAGVLFAFDFMHFTQSRIATIDVYITFFVIWMYFFLYRYIAGSLAGLPWSKNVLFLGLSGVCMGLGVACKWTGVYAGIGLAVLFFWAFYLRYRDRTFAGSRSEMLKTIGFCLVFFVCIPALIYLLSYLPFSDGVRPGLMSRMLHNQETMFRYHTNLQSTHPFSSPWYQWPIMERPIWYYSGTVSDTVREGISAFGNPLVWWVGIPALLYMIFRILRHRDGRALFLVVGYAAQYLPWMFVSRLTFIYHYFPSVAFVVLMNVYSLQCVTSRLGAVRGPRGKYLFPACALVYGAAAVGLFLLFYPVLSGAPVEISYVDRWLRWQEGWVLVAP